ncbi:MAG: ribonuclease Z [Chlamydia sp.]
MTIQDLVILGTSSQQPTRFRNHGAYLFRWNNEGLLFDPGEGTQRQFIFAEVSPTCVTRIFISHFHGDHCLGLGSMLMRLNLDKVTHPIHCYYPASGKKYFDRLRYSTIYHEQITVVEHPIDSEGIVHTDGSFTIEARFLDHGIENIGWRITEKEKRRFVQEKLDLFCVSGPDVKRLEKNGSLLVNGRTVHLDDVSFLQPGNAIAIVIDTRPVDAAIQLGYKVKILLCESTYLSTDGALAVNHKHMTALEAAHLAKEAMAEKLILTHFSARHLDEALFENEARKVFQNSFAAKDFMRFPFRS